MTADQANELALFAFVAGLVVALGSTLFRILHLWLRGHELPYLIWRDLVVFGGFALTFVLIACARVFEWDVRDELWWTAVTAIPSLVAVWTYVVYELFVIGHRRDR